MARRLPLIPVALLLLGLAPRAVLACKCVRVGPPPTASKLLSAYDAVFTGVIKTSSVYSLERTYVVSVTSSWKGTRDDEVCVLTGSDGSFCGAYFEAGNEYLICAKSTGRGLFTTLCDHNLAICDAQDMINQLNYALRTDLEASRNQEKSSPNNRLQGTGTLKVGQASKVLFRLAVLRKRSPVPEPGVRSPKEEE